MPLVTYSALRLGLLAACFGLGYWAGLRTWLLLVVATFAALGLSYVLLGRQREAAALYVAGRVEQRARRGPRLPGSADADAAHEDSLVDAAQDDVVAEPPRRDAYPGETARPSPNSTP